MNKLKTTEKALMLVMFLFFVLLFLVIVEQGKVSSQQVDNNAMQLEIRARSIAQYGTYED